LVYYCIPSGGFHLTAYACKEDLCIGFDLAQAIRGPDVGSILAVRLYARYA
jgi:hypothetical protein